MVVNLSETAREFAVRAILRYLEHFDSEDVAVAMFHYFAKPKWRPLPLLTTDDVRTLWELVEIERARRGWHAQLEEDGSGPYRAVLERLAGVLKVALETTETRPDGRFPASRARDGWSAPTVPPEA